LAKAARPAQDLAAAVSHQIGAVGDVRIGNHQIIGGGVNQNRDSGRLGDLAHLLQAEPDVLEAVAKDRDHRRARVDGRAESLL